MGQTLLFDICQFCNGDPVNNFDPTGRFFGEDDAVVFGVGAIIGTGAHGLSDLTHGQFTGWPGYGRAFLAGGVGAETTYLTAPVLGLGAFGAGGAAAGFTDNSLKQMNTVSSDGYNYMSAIKDTGTGLAVGQLAMFLPGASTIGTPSALFDGFTGLNAGANSFAAIESSTMTKLESGNLSIASMSGTTWGKIFSNETYNGVPSEGLTAAQSNESDTSSPNQSAGALVTPQNGENTVVNGIAAPSGDPLSAQVAKWKN